MRRPLRYTIDADSLADRDNYHDPEEVDAYIDSLEAERDQLRVALECLVIAVAGAGGPNQAERELLHDMYREAVSLLASLKEAEG